MIRKLFPVIKPYKISLALVFCLVMLSSILEGLSVSVVIPLFQVFSNTQQGDGIASNGIFAMYQKFVKYFDPGIRLQYILLIVFLAFLLKNMVVYLNIYVRDVVTLKIRNDIRYQIFNKYMNAPYHFHLSSKQGRLLNDLLEEPTRTCWALRIFISYVANLGNLLALTLLLFLISWKIVAVIFLLAAVLLSFTRQLGRLFETLGKQKVQMGRDITSFSAEVISGIRQIKTFSAEKRMFSEFFRLHVDYLHLFRKYANLRALSRPMTEVLVVGLICSMIAVSFLFMPENFDGVLPMIGTTALIVFRLFPTVSNIHEDHLGLRAHAASVDATVTLLADIPQEPVLEEGKRFSSLRKNIAFEAVSFSYSGGPGRKVLDAVTVRFERGKKTAIVGRSGAGKSTLADLILRIYDPTDGCITIDGTDLREYALHSWRNAIGFVSQDTFIFNASIKDNIAFSKPDATMEEIIWAAKQAYVHELIERLPDGCDTVVGDRGLKLSGGERQRIAIARAILRNPQILILDEATSSLDYDSEYLVQRALHEVSLARTVIIIAHRLSTVIDADKIIVLDEGRVVEEGTHESLLARKGTYWKLYTDQFRTDLLEVRK